ncbi:MAG: hypothetical protein E7262_01295 [Lachnospiraceae bacterium]|nr:hypothetical protein [Lachnospiraceae bacterium]
MPLIGDKTDSHSFVDEKEAEVIVNQYFSYIEDIGLSFDWLGVSAPNEEHKMDIANIVESITTRLERTCETM